MNCFHHGAPLCRYFAASAAFGAAAGAPFVGFAAALGAAAFFTFARALVTFAARARTVVVLGRAAFFFAERELLLVYMQRTH